MAVDRLPLDDEVAARLPLSGDTIVARLPGLVNLSGL